MIKLTGTSGIAIYINPNKIIGLNEEVNGGGSFVNYGNDSYVVTESPQEVARKVLEYRLAVVRYKALAHGANTPLEGNLFDRIEAEAQDEFSILHRLAGLEE